MFARRRDGMRDGTNDPAAYRTKDFDTKHVIPREGPDGIPDTPNQIRAAVRVARDRLNPINTSLVLGDQSSENLRDEVKSDTVRVPFNEYRQVGYGRRQPEPLVEIPFTGNKAIEVERRPESPDNPYVTVHDNKRRMKAGLPPLKIKIGGGSRTIVTSPGGTRYIAASHLDPLTPTVRYKERKKFNKWEQDF